MRGIGWANAGSFMPTGRGQARISGNNGKRYGAVKGKKKKATSIGSFRLRAILLKFNAGKKLTNEEMTFLQREQPETFIKVRQIQAERTLLEKRMKAAKTKEETADAYMSSLSGMEQGGKKGASNAEAMVSAKLNQMSDARQKYMATREYQAKDDVVSRTEQKRFQREEQADRMEEQRVRIEENIERQEAQRKELSFSQEERVYQEAESKIDKAKDIMKDVERLKRVGRRKRKKVAVKNKKKGAEGNSATAALASREELRHKLRKLIQENQDYKETVSKELESASPSSGEGGAAQAPLVSEGGMANVGSMVDISL